VSPDALAAQVMAMVIRNPGVKVSNPLRGAATIDVGGGKVVKAFPVPGHTSGSYAFLYDGVLLCGDIMILKEGRLEPTPAVFDAHPAENRDAIRSLKKQLGGQTMETICTAHGGCTPKGLGSNLLDDLIGRIGAGG
jgi:glyoxylase-like metal-dependent hydrolase (beta-lactamase superfamily II)